MTAGSASAADSSAAGASGVFVHERALVETSAIGSGTRIWAFAHVMPGARIGAECNICDHTFVEGDVLVGDRVTIKSGVYLWDGVRLEDDVFVGPQATFTNDSLRANSTTTIRRGRASARRVILPGTVGEGAMVGGACEIPRGSWHPGRLAPDSSASGSGT